MQPSRTSAGGVGLLSPSSGRARTSAACCRCCCRPMPGGCCGLQCGDKGKNLSAEKAEGKKQAAVAAAPPVGAIARCGCHRPRPCSLCIHLSAAALLRSGEGAGASPQSPIRADRCTPIMMSPGAMIVAMRGRRHKRETWLAVGCNNGNPDGGGSRSVWEAVDGP